MLYISVARRAGSDHSESTIPDLRSLNGSDFVDESGMAFVIGVPYPLKSPKSHEWQQTL